MVFSYTIKNVTTLAQKKLTNQTLTIFVNLVKVNAKLVVKEINVYPAVLVLVISNKTVIKHVH